MSAVRRRVCKNICSRFTCWHPRFFDRRTNACRKFFSGRMSNHHPFISMPRQLLSAGKHQRRRSHRISAKRAKRSYGNSAKRAKTSPRNSAKRAKRSSKKPTRKKSLWQRSIAELENFDKNMKPYKGGAPRRDYFPRKFTKKYIEAKKLQAKYERGEK